MPSQWNPGARLTPSPDPEKHLEKVRKAEQMIQSGNIPPYAEAMMTNASYREAWDQNLNSARGPSSRPPPAPQQQQQQS